MCICSPSWSDISMINSADGLVVNQVTYCFGVNQVPWWITSSLVGNVMISHQLKGYSRYPILSHKPIIKKYIYIYTFSRQKMWLQPWGQVWSSHHPCCVRGTRMFCGDTSLCLAFFFNRWFLFTIDLTQTSTKPKNQEAGKPSTKQTPRRGGWKLTGPIIGIWRFPKMGVPNSWMDYNEKSKNKMDDLGVPPFQETSISV